MQDALGRRTFGEPVRSAIARLATAEHRDLGRVGFALARAGAPPADADAQALAQALAKEAAARAAKLPPQALRNVALGLATVHVAEPKAVAAICDAVVERADGLDPRSVALLLEAFRRSAATGCF